MSLMAIMIAGIDITYCFIFIISILFRVVVPPNEVHIVQSTKSTISYGKDTGNGNTYYKFPSWVPCLGVTTIALPVSVFTIKIEAYKHTI